MGADNLKFKAVFLDFYGTLVHEDDDIIPIICDQIKVNTSIDCNVRDIGIYWWIEFSNMFRNSYGELFQTQRALGINSLSKTIMHFKSKCIAEEIIRNQFQHWVKPKLYEDTKPFLETLSGIPVYILSNIDSTDIHEATAFHEIKVTDILTSEDVKSYKPRPELFLEALRRNNLNSDEVIHIGDSITSDVGGAQNLGIRTIWLNRLNKSIPEDIKPDYIFKDLIEVRTILFG
jgi:HAD superfamily hydrolase (TIGR01549 family)